MFLLLRPTCCTVHLIPLNAAFVQQLINNPVMSFIDLCFSLILSGWLQVQEANAQLAEQDAEVTPVQRRIEPRSADDSLSGVVRCLCFADTFLRDGMNKSVLCSANDACSIHRFLFKQGSFSVLEAHQAISKQKWRIRTIEIFQDTKKLSKQQNKKNPVEV